MSRWLDMFRSARVQIDTPVQLVQLGALRSRSDLTAPKNLTAPGVDGGKQASAVAAAQTALPVLDEGGYSRSDTHSDGEHVPPEHGGYERGYPGAVSALSALRSAWGDASEAVAWFASWSPPGEPFQLKPGITILDPRRWRQSIAADIAQGPSGPRARYGALQDDLRRLHAMFGGGQSGDCVTDRR